MLLSWLLYMCRAVLSYLSHVWLFATLWTVAHQASLSMGFSKQVYWSGLPFLSPGDLSDPGIESVPLMSPALTDGFFTISTTWEAHCYIYFQPLKKKKKKKTENGYIAYTRILSLN